MKKIFAFLLISLSTLSALEENELVWDAPQGPSVQEYNSALQDAIAAQNWWLAVDYAQLISYNFPSTPFAQDAAYIIGEAYYKLGQLEYSNEAFTAYLNQVSSPRHFEEAIHYKFMIAEQFALKIYDEVIAALPHSEICAKALLAKSRIQVYFEDFKPGIETLDLLIRRFPKGDLAAEAYLEKGKVYSLQCQGQNLDPDILDLTEVNLRKFKLAFPREMRIAEAEKIYSDMQEAFAENLFETGRFFERTKKIPASIIYYTKVIAKYPNTQAAQTAKEKLETFQAAGKL